MNKAEIAQSCFENLPHINKCWVTDDGHYHLHGVHGGEKFERGVEATKEVAKEVIEQPKSYGKKNRR